MSDIPRTVGRTDVSPQEAGYRASRLDVLDDFFLRLIGETKLQCASYLLARRGKIFACRSFGSLLPGRRDLPFLPDSIRTIASVTKVFTAVALFQLMEQGKLTLTQPVSTLIKEFDTDAHRKIRIDHLLTHTSGLAPDPGFCLEPYPSYRSGFKDMEEFLKYALRGPLQAQPGERWAYCTNGFVVLGEIVARVSGMQYREFVRERILDPLGLADTHFQVPDEKKDRFCFTGETGAAATSDRLWDAGGGLHSTLYDLFRFGQMMLDRGRLDGTLIVSRKSVERMTANRLRDVPADAWETHLDDKPYGLGWSLSCRSVLTPDVFEHEGAGRVMLLVDPREELVVVYFIPTAIPWVPESLLCPLAMIWSGLE
jgi:CubicO group peptidase (beta-lactamase class C family)